MKQGWNLINQNLVDYQTVMNIFNPGDEKINSIWAAAKSGWMAFSPFLQSFNDLELLEPNFTYWINANDSFALKLSYP